MKINTDNFFIKIVNQLSYDGELRDKISHGNVTKAGFILNTFFVYLIQIPFFLLISCVVLYALVFTPIKTAYDLIVMNPEPSFGGMILLLIYALVAVCIVLYQIAQRSDKIELK